MSRALPVLLALATFACSNVSRGPTESDVKKQISGKLTINLPGFNQTVTPQDITIRDRMLKETEATLLVSLQARSGKQIEKLDCKFIFDRFEKSWRLRDYGFLMAVCKPAV